MLYRAMNSAASGMDAFLFNLDTIANNLANAGTTGFKRSRSDFQDLFYQNYKLPGAQDGLGNTTPVGLASGHGTRIAATQQDFTQGNLLQTGQNFDLAIDGDGFFQVSDGANIYYTRNGQFTLNNNGAVVLATADKGWFLQPQITIPQDATNVSISADGVVSVLQAGATTANQLGNLQVFRFLNPQGLLQQGDTLFQETQASGANQPNTPGQQGSGLVRQGYLEISNVEPARELVDLIKTQRNVELNSQVVQASDQLLQLVSNLRR